MAAYAAVSGPAVISGIYHVIQGALCRFRYPDFYKDNSNYTLWANNYAPAPRAIDPARLIARGYLGPNSSFANIYAVNSTDLRACKQFRRHKQNNMGQRLPSSDSSTN